MATRVRHPGGRIGKRTATGLVITPASMFVALPHRMALGKHVEIRRGARVTVVPVLDVGPWNTDDSYWTEGRRRCGARPRPVSSAEQPRGHRFVGPRLRRPRPVRQRLDQWRFVHQGYYALPRAVMEPDS